jgi:NitT/TauT family transport system substrate-binding protein
VVAAIGLAVATIALSACSSSGGSSDSASADGLTTINVSNTLIVGDEVPLVYANATNLWKKYGLNVHIVTVTSSAQFASLGAGQADIALGGAASIEAAQKGAPEQLIGSMGKVRMDFLVPSSVKTVQDLRGKTLGASSPGSLLGAGQQLYMKEQGLNFPGDYKIVYTSGSFAATITALVGGRVQGSFAAHPFIDTAMSGNPDLHTLARIDQTNLGILTANVATVNSSWASSHKDAIVKFIQAWQEASKEVPSHLKETAGYLATAAKISNDVATKWVTDQAPLDGIFSISSSDFDTIKKALAIGFPEVASADYGKSVDNSFVNAANGS